jgi:hypothetical protein
MENGVFRNGRSGYKTSQNNISYLSNTIFYSFNFNNNESCSSYFFQINYGTIKLNIFLNNNTACKIKDYFKGVIEKNYILKNYNGLELWDFYGNISHNNLINNNIDIYYCGQYYNNEAIVEIEYNNFNSISNFVQFNAPYASMDSLIVNYNNIKHTNYYFAVRSINNNKNINAVNNYYYDLGLSDILTNIWDSVENSLFNEIEIIPISNNEIETAGIK